MTEQPTWQFGRMHFEDGVRPVLLWRGRKFYHAFFIDSLHILRRYVTFEEEKKFFKEWGNSIDDPRIVKRTIRVMLNKSPITGLKREMTKATKKTLKSGLE